MGRIWARKTNRERITEQQLRNALEEVRKGSSIRRVAISFNISKSSLARHVSASQHVHNIVEFKYNPNIAVKQVFSTQQEEMICQYLKTASKMHYGLSTKQVKRLAYQYAIALKLQLPRQWEEKKEAGKEWLFGFMRRNRTLSIRAPEATSLSRSTSFNEKNVGDFFSNVKKLYDRHAFRADLIWNCDETALTTVHKPPKIIGEKGAKQIGQVTSAERGQLITLCCFVNATGNTVPPAFVFPRVNFKDFMLHGAPPGSLGLSHKSGWMTSDNFLLTLRHFIKHIKCSRDDPVVLFLDNHDSHVNISVIQEAKDNGVLLITFPPHCSHRLQPLDVCVYGPLKARYNQACDNWMTANPGKTLTIYNIAELGGSAFNSACTKDNIIKGFQKTGIWPYNPSVFSNDDFLMSYVTDRPFNENEQGNESTSVDKEHCNINCGSNESRFCEMNIPSTSTSTCMEQVLTPEHIMPYPKAAPRKVKQCRKRGKTRILTDTPEKEEIEELQKNKKCKQKIEQTKKRLGNGSSILPNNRKKETVIDDTDSSSESSMPDLHDSSGDEDLNFEKEDDFDFDIDSVTVGDFVLCKFLGKKQIVHYAARVNTLASKEMEVSFLRRKGTSSKFVFPTEEDSSTIPKSDIVLKLPSPQCFGGTQRTSSIFSFEINFDMFKNVR
ncbi:uncharacterized protein LOC116162896 [Photinus pyralis]|nr:uncharacterized protein LOC116162895 isoform X1 [Photinus pyralis]XP_031332517.1 uncharacterized protein LOC116162895 isoform X1 [Photinus pyralis]XP_031332519.1 uncharacterized protein LOC116162896 [Photinus pyralis]